MATVWPNVPNDQDLHHGRVKFTTQSKHDVTIKTVWQDTMPSGSQVGTLIAVHGSPGSHNDFKYIGHYLRGSGIRVIALNMPGHGYTQNHKRIGFHNVDRNAYLQAMLDKLAVSGPIIFVGHSRGTENALNICAMNVEDACGLILINPSGLRMHRGIRPFFIIQFASWMYNVNLLSLQKIIMHPILYHIYNRLVRLKTKSGKIAAVCVQSMRTFGLERQRPYVTQMNENVHIPILLAYSGKDFLIEDDIVREMLAEFSNSEELILEDSKAEDTEHKAMRWFRSRLPQRQALGVCFRQDGHHLQKFKARFLSDAIVAMFDQKR